jgi:ABC-type transport system involved in multi-copper enzyme maturation permease subunit
MTGQLRAELLKLRTARSTRALLASMIVLTALVVSLHALTLSAADLSTADNQPHVFGWAPTLGALFGALVGGIAVTAEFRYGTIRPTLLITPDRRRVLAAKAITAAVDGLGVGLLVASLVAAVGSLEFALRDIPVRLSGGDIAQLLAGSTLAAALWAVIGVGIGALVRGQVGTVIGLCVWLLLLENILIGNISHAAKYSPGASAGALAGMLPDAGSAKLLAPAGGGILLVGYALAISLGGLFAFNSRDID